jgi:hypothetical protein
MQPAEVRRMIVRHRHVAPMLSVLLSGTDARVRITDVEGEVILDRGSRTVAEDSPSSRYPIVVEGDTVAWVDGPRPAGAIAAVLSYAVSREMDKRSLAREALDRYRELNLIYDLAERIAGSPRVDDVAAVAAGEASRLPSGGEGFILLRSAESGALEPHPRTGPAGPLEASDPGDGLIGAIFAGEAEIVNDVASDPRTGAGGSPVASIVAAPLSVDGERLGVIGTASRTPLEFHAGDLKILVAIAALTGPAIAQAYRYDAIADPERDHSD